jgi:hypothetical protein
MDPAVHTYSIGLYCTVVYIMSHSESIVGKHLLGLPSSKSVDNPSFNYDLLACQDQRSLQAPKLQNIHRSSVVLRMMLRETMYGMFRAERGKLSLILCERPSERQCFRNVRKQVTPSETTSDLSCQHKVGSLSPVITCRPS